MTQTDIDFIIEALNNKCTALVQEIVNNANDAIKLKALAEQGAQQPQEPAPEPEQVESEVKEQPNE